MLEIYVMRALVICFLSLLLVLVVSAQKPNKQKSKAEFKNTLLKKVETQAPDEIPIVVLDVDAKTSADNNFIATLLQANKDPFYNTATFGFSAAGFMVKGLDASFSQTLLNGLPIKNLLTGTPNWTVYSGLQEMMRKNIVADGQEGNELTYGTLGAVTGVDIRALFRPKQEKFAVSFSNRAFTHKYSLQISTGQRSNGWAFAGYATARLAKEGYYAGCGYAGYGYLLTADKKILERVVLSISLLGAPIWAERQAPVLVESLTYFGKRYNPNWGMQNNLKRSAVISVTHLPTLLFSTSVSMPAAQKINLAIGITMGSKSVTALDWNGTVDPRADYYKYLPSYYQDSALHALMVEAVVHDENKGQLDWASLYAMNNASVDPVLIGTAPGLMLQKKAVVILENRIDAQKILAASILYQSPIGKYGLFTAGINTQLESHHLYKQVADLLGADYYVNLNQFAEDALQIRTNVNQYDLENPNQIIRLKQNFGYNYKATLSQTEAFLQSSWVFTHVDVFAGIHLAGNSFGRVGLVKNGLFPIDSKGPSFVYHFTSPSSKIGTTYKFNARHYVTAQMSSQVKAPLFDNVFVAPKMRATVTRAIASEKIFSMQLGYHYNSDFCKLMLRAFLITQKEVQDVLTFYHDGFHSFVNYELTGINKIMKGLEASVDFSVNENLSVQLIGALSDYRYNSRQHLAVSSDNDAGVLEEGTVYVNNFRIARTPQRAAALNISYRAGATFYAMVGAHYMDNRWMSFNPIRRTYAALATLDTLSALCTQIFEQAMLPSIFTLNVLIGQSFRWQGTKNKEAHLLSCSLSINNILQTDPVLQSGYEQLRFDVAGLNLQKFPPKYFFGYGRNFSATISYSF